MSRGPNSETVIQRPDLIHRLQQFLGLRQLPVVPHLRDGVQSVIIMGDVREVATEKVITRPCIGHARKTTFVAGEHSAVTLRNPPESGVVVRVQDIVFANGPCIVTLEAGIAPLGVLQTVSFRDLQQVGPRPRAELYHDGAVLAFPAPATQLAVIGAAWVDNDPGNPFTYVTAMGSETRGPWTLHPGFQLRLDQLVNDDVMTFRTDFTFWWTETSMGAS